LISLLRNFNALSLVLLLVYTLGLQANLLVYPVENIFLDDSSNVFNLISPLFEWISFGHYPILLAIFSILLFAQALLVNHLVNSNEFYEKKSFIPAASYVLLLSLFNRQLFLTPAFFALFFVIFAISRILLVHRDRGFTHIFDTGFFVSMAGLFYQPAFLLMFLVPYGLFQAAILDWKAWATSFIGFATPIYLMAIYLFVSGSWEGDYLSNAFSNWSLIDLPILTNNLMMVKMAILLILFIVSAVIVSQRFLKSTIQLRRYLTFMMVAVVFSLAISIFAGTHFSQALALAVIPLSVMLAFFLHESQKGFIVELIHLACLTVVIVIQFTVET